MTVKTDNLVALANTVEPELKEIVIIMTADYEGEYDKPAFGTKEFDQAWSE